MLPFCLDERNETAKKSPSLKCACALAVANTKTKQKKNALIY